MRRRATHAWRDGWLSHPFQDEPAKPARTEPFCVDTSKIKPIPKHEIQMFEQGWYKWRGFRVQAWSFEEAYPKLNDQWVEKQRRDQEVKNLGKRRQAERLHLVNLDDKHRNTALEHLKHPNYKQVFVGRFSVHGGRVTFVEEGTWISESVVAPSQAKSMHGADVPKARDKQLYVALRAAHSKESCES